MDIYGPIKCKSLEHGNKYVLGFIDIASRYVVQYFLKNKSDVTKYITTFYNEYILPLRAADPTKYTRIFLNTDMGEANSDAFNSKCQQLGVTHTMTCPYSSNQNAVIERQWRTMTSAAISLLLTSGLSE